MEKRRDFTPEEKAKMVIEVLREEKTFKPCRSLIDTSIKML
jgi:transposase-like protein